MTLVFYLKNLKLRKRTQFSEGHPGFEYIAVTVVPESDL